MATDSSVPVAQPPAWKAVFAEPHAMVDESQRAVGLRQRQDRVTVIESSQDDAKTEDETAGGGWGGGDEAPGSGGGEEASGSGGNTSGMNW